MKPVQLTRAGLRVEALRIALLAHLDRRVDEDLDEDEARVLVDQPRVVAPGPVGADHRDQRDHPGVGEQAGDLGDAPHVLGAVGGR